MISGDKKDPGFLSPDCQAADPQLHALLNQLKRRIAPQIEPQHKPPQAGELSDRRGDVLDGAAAEIKGCQTGHGFDELGFDLGQVSAQTQPKADKAVIFFKVRFWQ